MKKKLVPVVLLVLVAVFAFALPTKAQAATIDSGKCGSNLTYVLDDSGTLTISGTGDMKNYDDDDPPWCDYTSTIKKLVIEDGVTSIGESAFSSCTALTSVTIPDSVTTIEGWAFSNCSKLSSLSIPDSVKDIGIDAFSYTAWYNAQPSGLVYAGKVAYQYKGTSSGSVTIASGTLGIAGNAFYCRTDITSVTIPNSVKIINQGAFLGCGVKSISIPSSVTYIGNYVFSDSYLQEITFNSGLLSIGEGAFKNTDLQTLVLPDTLAGIGNDAFRSCTSLTSVSIPASMTRISNRAFYGCSNLTSLVLPSTLTYIGEWGFLSCSKLSTVHYTGTQDQWAKISIGESNTAVTGAEKHYGTYHVSNCINTGYFCNTCNDFVTRKGADGTHYYSGGVCYKCGAADPSKITESGICGDNVTWYILSNGNPSGYGYRLYITGTGPMYDYTRSPWDGNQSLYSGSIIVQPGVTYIGSYAFAGTLAMDISIPATVTDIGYRAFSSTPYLESIYVNINSTSYISDNGLLYNKDKTVLLFVPGSIYDSITIPKSVTRIEADTLGTYYWNDIYYLGTEEEWTQINIDACPGIKRLTIYCNSCIGSVTHSYSNNQDDLCDLCGYARPLESLILVTPPDKVSYTIGEYLDLSGIHLTGSYADGTAFTMSSANVPNVSADLSSAGKKEVTITVADISVSFFIYVHEKRTTTITVPSSQYPQSSHNYENNLNETKTFTYSGATSLQITFSTSTELENNYDKLFVYDGVGSLVAQYTGTQAAGVTLTIPGNSFSIHLKTDGSVQKYGYSFSRIQAITTEIYHPIMELPMTATCTEAGLTAGTCCEICGLAIAAQQPMAALGHDWIPATCLDPQTCDRCGEIEGEPLGHNWLDATCTVPSTCDRCRDTQGEALGHSWLEATCTAPMTCRVCGATEGSALGHDWIPATCLDPQTCDRCGHTVGSPLGHAGNLWIPLIPASCTKEGLSARICTRCSVTETAVTAALGHNYQAVVTAPTCTEQGYTTHSCNRCGNSYVDSFTNATGSAGHNWSSWVQIKTPTCTVNGTEKRFCNCGIVETRSIQTLPHSFENGICTGCTFPETYNWVLTAPTGVYMTLTQDLYIDLNGYSISGTIIPNGYKIYGMDSATNSYTCQSPAYFNCVDENENTVIPESLYTSEAGMKYLTICTEEGYSFHRYHLAITHISLLPASVSFGYKAEFFGDEMVQAEVASQSYALWLTEDATVTRSMDGFRNVMTLRLQNFDVENHGETLVYAMVSMSMKDGTLLNSAVEAWSLRQMLELVDQYQDNLTETQRNDLQDMIDAHPVIATWNIGNLLRGPDILWGDLTPSKKQKEF